MLKFNPDTKIIFDNDEAAVAPIREITRDEVPDLIANGSSVDASANVGEQTSSAAQTAGDVQAAQDPAVPVTGSDTGADTGNAAAAVTGSPNVTAATDASFASSVDTQPAAASSSTSPSTESTADASVDAPEPVVTDAQADPGGAGSADLNPTPAAPNLDAQAQSNAVPLAAGGAVDTPAAEVADEHPLTIIGEIEELVRMVGNAAVHEYQRLIQRLADLKNHPAIKDE